MEQINSKMLEFIRQKNSNSGLLGNQQVSDLSLGDYSNESLDTFLDGLSSGVSLVGRTNCSAGGQNPCIAI